jgi:hypothetical protein
MISYKNYLNRVSYESREYARFKSDILSDRDFNIYKEELNLSDDHDYKIIEAYLKSKKSKPEILMIFYNTFIDYILDCNSYSITQEDQDKLIKELYKLKDKIKHEII